MIIEVYDVYIYRYIHTHTHIYIYCRNDQSKAFSLEDKVTIFKWILCNIPENPFLQTGLLFQDDPTFIKNIDW